MGVKIMKLNEGDKVVSVAKIIEENGKEDDISESKEGYQ
jgi:hypothetical protein